MSQAAGLSVEVTGGPLTAARDRILQTATDEGLAAALAGKDAELWGPDARPEASIRLGWLDLPTSSRDLLPRLSELGQSLADDGLGHVVLAGMGGSSLAPEVICRTAGVELTVLDTTDPGQVRAALADRLEQTVVVVSSKSGGTIETDSHRRAYTQAFRNAGLDPGRHFVAVTDPGSPLEQTARSENFREVFLADPNVGGRYSALTAFGLVPTALAGVDVAALLDEAAALSPVLRQGDGNPALELGAVLGGAAVDGRDKVVLADAGSGIAGFGDWAEQLIAESTGKEGKGLLPVVVSGPDAPGTAGADVQLVLLAGNASGGGFDEARISVSGPLGAQFLAWEYATAVAGWVLRINPFDQPNVTESKDNTARILSAGLPEASPALVDGSIEVYADPQLVGPAKDLRAVVSALLDAVPDRGYLAVMAYLDRFTDAEAAGVRDALAGRIDRPVTFGWAPRFLHSTGQYHKGGPQVGTFLQITGAVAEDLPIPGRDYTFGTLQAAQAAGDREALTSRGRPLVHLHLTDRRRGVQQLLEATR